MYGKCDRRLGCSSGSSDHARPGAIPVDQGPPIVLLTMCKLRLTGMDVHCAIDDVRTDDGGKTWTGPVEHGDTLGRQSAMRRCPLRRSGREFFQVRPDFLLQNRPCFSLYSEGSSPYWQGRSYVSDRQRVR